jgi:hypothetical protein
LQEQAHTHKTAAAPAPLTPMRIDTAETRLKTALPALLRQIYLEVGPGGFGPGEGLRGLPDALLPGRLYPLCDWGGGILSALDCTKPEAPVIRLDPNMPKADVPVRVPTALHFDRAAEVKQACWVESPSLEQWLTGWLDGQPLFYAAYRGSESEEDDENMDDEEEDGEEDA